MKIINIKCEYLTNPIGIDILHPRITWCYESESNNESFVQKYFIVHYSINNNKEKDDIMVTYSMNYTFKDKFKSRGIVNYWIEVVGEDGNHYFSEKNSFEFGLFADQSKLKKLINNSIKFIINVL